jgi:tRNA(adenine34) deaminase
MCAGATIIGRVSEVFYAFNDPKMGAMGGAISLHELPRSNHKPIVHQGILKEQCLQLTQAFFHLRRQESCGKVK